MNLKITGLKVDQGGPGSRGGKVIGRTKSGKPIYEQHNHPAHLGLSRPEVKEANKIREKKIKGFAPSVVHQDPTTNTPQAKKRKPGKSGFLSQPARRFEKELS